MTTPSSAEATVGTHARADCRIYVVVEAGAAAVERLNAAAAVAEIASCLILPPPGGMLDAAAAAPLVNAAQRAGIAALVADDAGLARALRADGVHLRTVSAPGTSYAEARERLGRGAIVGADPGLSRHDAMTLAEAGADYIGFGAPAHVQDRLRARERRDDLVSWWSEIFEVPCVAFDVETVEEAARLARIGADFVGVTLPAGLSAAQVRDLAAGISDALGIATAAG